MSGSRLTPPSNQDGKFGFQAQSASRFDTEETAVQSDYLDPDTAQRLGVECYTASTDWINSGRRSAWSNNLRAFQGLHPSGSKYLSRDFNYRSSMYRPISRMIIRRAEMQTAQAFFSNEDVVNITAQDDNDPKQLASAEINKALLQYRLTHSIPWFLTLIGARQDAEVMGICIAKAYWKYEEAVSHTEERPQLDPDGFPQAGPDGTLLTEQVDIMRTIHDKPVVDLISPENFRFEAGCDWRDPVASSPYLIELMPMYISDVIAKMESGEWKQVPESALRAASDPDDDTTRRSRESGRTPGKDNEGWKPRDFDICWVRANIIKWRGQDWHFYSLSSAGELLSDPVPLRDVYLHGERPYVAGFTVLETHKTYPSGKLELVKDLQRAANDLWNMRYDNIKLNLNPRQFIRTGVATEVADIRAFMPGKVVVVNTKPAEDMRNAITWDRPPPMDDNAAYAEQDRINLDCDQLTGAFTNSSVQSSQIQQQSATGMHLMSGEASGMNEYELKCFAETFVEKLIRLLMKLEQAYEVDPVILAIAGRNAQIYQKYGIDQITDALIEGELTTKVNVGVGASNPQIRLRNMVAGADILGKIFGPSAAQGANFQEVAKEVFGMLGYRDGSRFFKPNFDPRVAMLEQQLQKLQGKGKGAAPDNSAAKIQTAQIQAQAHVAAAKTKADADMQRTAMEVDNKRGAKQSDEWRTMFKSASDNAMMQYQLDHSTGMQERDHGHEAGLQAGNALIGAMAPQPGGPNGGPGAGGPPAPPPAPTLDPIMAILKEVADGNQQIAAAMAQLAQAQAQMAQAAMAPKRVVRGADGRAVGVEIVR